MMADSLSSEGAMSGVDDLLGLFGSPIVVLIDERSVLVVQFQNRIGQHAAYSEGGQRGTNRPDHDFGRGGPTNDKAADHDVVTSADLAACRDIAHGGIARGKIVEFAKCVPLGAIGTSENSGVTSGRQTGHNDRFGRV